MSNCIFLTGAPEADGLTWADGDLLSTLESPIRRFLGHNVAPASTRIETSTFAMPRWRDVSMTDSHHGHRLDVPASNERPQTQFLSFDEDDVNAHDRLRFLEQSLARLDDMDSSQIAPVAEDTTFLSTGSFNSSFESTSYPTSYGSLSAASQATQSAAATLPPVHCAASITDIRRIPSADHLLRIAPQTVTVNLLAGVISVSPSRTVRLRKRNGEMNIVELLVGDETRAGFSISFWLAPADSQRRDLDDMRNALRQLRSGDVVLLQNIALSAFNKCVYGQSLSKRFARNSTSLVVLAQSQGLFGPLQGKYDRVLQWSCDFVGRDPPRAATSTTKQKGKQTRQEELPPDTQSPTKGG